MSFDVIEHLADDGKFIEICLGLLKKGGRLIIGTPNIGRLTARLQDLVRGKRKFPYSYGKNEVCGDILHLREYDKKMLFTLFSKFLPEIRFEIRPFFLGIRGVKKLFGIKEPKFLGSISSYWIVYAEKI